MDRISFLCDKFEYMHAGIAAQVYALQLKIFLMISVLQRVKSFENFAHTPV